MTTRRFHLTFPEHLIEEPVLYRVGREFDVVTNIRRANIDERSAWVILEIGGPDDRVEAAVRWLADQGVQVDRIEGD
ncbi:MAG TPA: NIL domain-containing protein [Actinomycetota bacterium]|nr:NIL domain-containing protein [Actinomycetota bacterium]